MTVIRLSRYRHARGFTLIELMIVVAVVAIIASIAYPSYQYAVLKGRRAQGRTAILELMQQEERYMTQNNSYMTFTAATANIPFKTFSGDNPASSAYDLTAGLCPDPSGSGTLANTECVQVIAAPRISDTPAGSLRMTSTGVKDCTATPAPNASATCWP